MPSAEVLASALLHLKNNPNCLRNGENSRDVRLRGMGRYLETHNSKPGMRPKELRG